MAGCHDQVGHQGRDRTVSLIRERLYWETLYRDTSTYVSQCSRCLRRKSKTQRAPMQPIFASQPMEIVHLDHLTLESCKGKIESVLVVTDHSLDMPKHIQLEIKLLKPLLRYCGNISLGTMVSHRKSLQIKVQDLNLTCSKNF